MGAASWGTLLLAALGALACVAPLLLVILAVAAFAPPRSSASDAATIGSRSWSRLTTRSSCFPAASPPCAPRSTRRS